jgi:hypothetical protein
MTDIQTHPAQAEDFGPWLVVSSVLQTPDPASRKPWRIGVARASSVKVAPPLVRYPRPV